MGTQFEGRELGVRVGRIGCYFCWLVVTFVGWLSLLLIGCYS